MELPWPFSGHSCRSESDMNDEDWALRALEQAQAMREGGSWEDANFDADGFPTAGDYNGDYPDEIHELLNARLSNDPNYAAEVARDLSLLHRGEQNWGNR